MLKSKDSRDYRCIKTDYWSHTECPLLIVYRPINNGAPKNQDYAPDNSWITLLKDLNYAPKNLNYAPKNQNYAPDNNNYAPKNQDYALRKIFPAIELPNCQLSTRMNLRYIQGCQPWIQQHRFPFPQVYQGLGLEGCLGSRHLCLPPLRGLTATVLPFLPAPGDKHTGSVPLHPNNQLYEEWH